MASLPIQVTAWGVESDKLGDEFRIYFFSQHNLRKLYLGEECVTEDASKALYSTDMAFITSELTKLLADDDFMDYLEAEFIF